MIVRMDLEPGTLCLGITQCGVKLAQSGCCVAAVVLAEGPACLAVVWCLALVGGPFLAGPEQWRSSNLLLLRLLLLLWW